MKMSSKDYPIAEESLAQTDDDIFKLAQVLVNLAVTALSDELDVQQAIDALYHYGDWRNMNLPEDVICSLKAKAVAEGDEV
jgi:hypothetical protein